ncbi:hypothetical protein [Paenarthrobacter nitroguajacolicus]|uniref:hypothetical protein n=1 Tax=Paenarthrobacter nitroguajacolicus TaxID=211146 RepID=UPI00248B0A50|nr:hypothetical protein [Paenarthrobacter nitroguajacolicus]MDI2032965.1 hypothetical protein [Paenarthrobacter nitroguajacolicus]
MESTHLTLRQIAQMATDNNGGAKGRELDRIAKSKGLTLSYTTVNKIIAGTYTSRPGVKTVEALAKLAGVPVAEAFRAAGLEPPQASLAQQLPPEADTLTPEQRRVVIDLTRVFIKQNRLVHELRQEVVGNADHPAPMNRAGESPAKRHLTPVDDQAIPLPDNWEDMAAYKGPTSHRDREREWSERGEGSQEGPAD